MKIALLTTTNSRKAGGLFYSVRNLGLSLYHKGLDLKLFSFDDLFSEKDLYVYQDLPMVKYHHSDNPILRPFAYSKNLIQLLKDCSPDIIHSQGIWMYSSYAMYHYKKNHIVKTIITPRGMLDPWAVKNSRWKKKIVGHLYEYDNLRSADCVHALCKSEYESIRKFGLKNPVAIIPNGFNIPNNPVYDRDHEKKVLLYIGRIHPKKGIKELISAIAIVKKTNQELLSNWDIRIAGWDQNGHVQELIKLTKELGLEDNIQFIGPVYENAKERELCRANAFVLTSFSEGLPMSVLEAWAYKLPVLMTDFCNIPEGFDNGAAIRVDTKPESIAYGLVQLFSLKNSELESIGQNGFNLVSNKFTWSYIADQTIELYNWLLGNADKPDFVYID